MAFRKVNKDFNSKPIAGFWTRVGEITGTLVKYVDSVNCAYPFFLIDVVTSTPASIEDGENYKDIVVPAGSLLGVMDSAALKVLRDVKYEGKMVRITSKGMIDHTYKDERGRSVAGKLRLYDVEVDEGEDPVSQAPKKSANDDLPF